MAGRGDNNKKGSAGRGASNQSNQGFVSDGRNEPKSHHDKHKSGGQRSNNEDKSLDQGSNRNTSTKSEKL